LPYSGNNYEDSRGHKRRSDHKLLYEGTADNIAFWKFVPPPNPDIICTSQSTPEFDSTFETCEDQTVTARFRVKFLIGNTALNTRMIRDLDFNFNIDAAGALTAVLGVTKLIDCSISPARSSAVPDLVASLGGIYSCFVFKDPILNTYRARIRGLDFDPAKINM
jgi:hypothetical protein